MTSRRFGHRAPLLWLVLPFVAGLVLAHAHVIPVSIAWLAAAGTAAFVALIAAKRHPRLWVSTLCAAMFLAGMGYYGERRQRLDEWHRLPPREARVSVRVDRLFAPRDATQSSGLGTIVGTEAHLADLRGQRVAFSWSLRPNDEAPMRSTVVAAIGVIAALPRDPPPNEFDAYLTNAGINFRLNRGRVLRIERAPSAYRAFCARASTHFTAILNRAVAEKRPELASVFRAMLLGQKHALSDAQDEVFLQSGTMHLFAISGLHIAVIAGGIHALLMLLRVPHLLQPVIGLGALWLYVDITGGAPSAVRAFLMVALWQTAFASRAPGSAFSALVTSALLVLLIAPMQVFSASFQMSYAIVATLLLLGLPLGETWQARWSPYRDLPEATWQWWHRWSASAWRGVSSVVALGVSTSLISAVCSVMYFGLLTPASFLSNLVLIPAAMLVISAGFVSLVCGLLGATLLSAICNHAAVLVLWLVERLVREVVQMPGAWTKAEFAATWVGPAALAALLAAIGYGYGQRWRWHRGGYLPPFVLIALVLGFAVTYR